MSAPTAGGDAGSMWSLRGSDGRIAPGWYLVPLRLFMGATFLFAGLQKLSNPDYFRASSPISIHAQMIGASHVSPIGGFLVHLAGASTLIGVLIAVGEVAVGIGTLLGLLTRVAAVGGALISLSLFMTVSYHASPYYTGSDIVFLAAWTPFILAGAGGAPAVDTWLASRPVVPADPGGDGVSRRTVISAGAVVGLVAAAAAVLAGAVAAFGRALAPASSTASEATLPGTGAGGTTTTTATSSSGATDSTSTTAAKPAGTSIGPASDVPVGGSAAFTDPSSGDPSLVIQHTADTFVAFDAVCPHEGCTVAYQQSARIIACPCHGSEFNSETGAVIRGPAPHGLRKIRVTEGPNGDLYVD